MDLTLGDKQISLKGAMFSGLYQVVAGSNGYISWASAPIDLDFHNTFNDTFNPKAKKHYY